MTDNKPMTKAQIVNHFAEKFEIPKKTAQEFVAEFAELAVAQTIEVGEFTIPGVGKLVKSIRKERIGHNPATGEKITIPEKTVVKMRLVKAVKDAVI